VSPRSLVDRRRSGPPRTRAQGGSPSPWPAPRACPYPGSRNPALAEVGHVGAGDDAPRGPLELDDGPIAAVLARVGFQETLELPGDVRQVPSSDFLYARMINDTAMRRPGARSRRLADGWVLAVMLGCRTSSFSPSAKVIPKILPVGVRIVCGYLIRRANRTKPDHNTLCVHVVRCKKTLIRGGCEGAVLIPLRHRRERYAVQPAATRSRGSRLGMRDLLRGASSCNVLFISRNEQG
jgi:hypothetical protein